MVYVRQCTTNYIDDHFFPIDGKIVVRFVIEYIRSYDKETCQGSNKHDERSTD